MGTAPEGSPVDPDKMVVEEGTVVVWQWLSFNRFFAPGEDARRPVNLNGCASVSTVIWHAP